MTGPRAMRSWLLALLLGIACACLGTRPLSAQITVTGTGGNAANNAVITWSHAVPAGSNRALVVGVAIRSGGQSVQSITFGAQSLSFLGRAVNGDNQAVVEIWTLLAPNTGTSTVTVTLNGGSKQAAGSISLAGVAQSGAFSAMASNATAGANKSSSPSVTIGSAAGNMVLSVLSAQGDGQTMTPPTGGTLRVFQTVGTSGGDIEVGGATQAGAASVTANWSLQSSTKWALGAISIAAAPTGTVIMGVSNAANPSTATPGQDITYTATHTNTGTIAATTIVSVEAIPANTDFKLASATFAPGTSGLTAVVAYSNNGGSTYVYAPVSGGGGAPAGHDRSVTNIRWTLTGSLSQTAPNNSYAVGFQARIR